MPEDRMTHTGSASPSADEGDRGAPPIAHEDIMQRLLEYQRKLREGLSPREAAQAVAEAVASRSAPRSEPLATATEPEPVVDLTAAEAELEQATAPGAGTPAAEAVEPGPERPAEPASAAEPPAEVASAAPPWETGSPAAAASEETAWAGPASSPDPGLAARVEQLEHALASVATQVSELRQRFQDVAIAADERLAELERTLAHLRRTER